MNTETEYLSVTPEMSDTINHLCGVVNDWAHKKGWNESEEGWTPRQVIMHKGEMLALMHSELSECLEFLRQKQQPAMDDHVPSITGESAELADVLIRIFHYCGKYGINLGAALRLKHDYNTRRPFRHGKNC
jgi:NTP pyrophosphatase (non-canonical NTP hydrolase)